MRKYNNKMKKTMILIGVLFIIIIIIFSYAIKKSIDIKRTAYKLTIGAILFDKDQNMLTLSEEGTLRIKWGGDYYLKYQEKDYDLGPHSVVYNSTNGDMSLYGKYYEVNRDGKVDIKKGETKVKSSVNSKFYKLADREYLIIDRTIESKDSSFVTSNYLIINLDKLGNATLLNDKTSYKTIQPTVLRTSAYTFDIANEKLNFGGEDIDLKKIIGSTNEYDEETYDLNKTKTEDDTTENNDNKNGGSGTGSGTGTGNGGSGSGGSGGSGTETGNGGTGNGSGMGGSGITGAADAAGLNNFGTNNNGTTIGNTSTINNNYSSQVSNNAVQQIINATKNTSVIRVTSAINTISVDYVVYDPDNEYKSVYVEVENTTNSQVNTIYLSKTDTNIVIRDLSPNVFYVLTFKYTYNDNNNILKQYTFDEVGVYTDIPNMNITATKITNKKIYYKISIDGKYTISGGSVNLYLNDQYTGISSSISAKGSVNEISGSDCFLDISSLNLSKANNDVLEIKLVSLSFNTYTINPSISYKFKY